MDLTKIKQGSHHWFGRFAHRAQALFGSNRFFYAVIALLVAQAAWIAISGRYPMAYDEQNHLGIVKLYAEHISPFWAEQPPGDAPYSAINRDPSYLYHYILSFPYRLIDLFSNTDTAKVITFRLMSIAMFAVGLALYRKLLLQTRASKALVHTVLAIFVLVPTVPFLTGQMNYDNMLFPLVAGLLLITTKLVAGMKSGKLDARLLLLFAGLGMLAGLVKFPFLPLLLGMAIWIVVAFVRKYGFKHWREVFRQFGSSFAALRRPVQASLVLLVLVAGVLFAERYVVNVVQYGKPVAACDEVLDEQRCMAFGPWKRNYDILQAKQDGTLTPLPPSTDPIYFTLDEWLNLLLWQFFYALNGPADGFSVGFPFRIPYFVGTGLAALGIVLAVIGWRRIWRQPFMKGLLFVALLYISVLWLNNYTDFRELHLATAIQARYIVIVLPILFLALALGYATMLSKWRLSALKAPLALATIAILLTQGGGIGVFILRSNPNWWWQSQPIINMNQAAQRILSPLVLDGEVRAPKQNY